MVSLPKHPNYGPEPDPQPNVQEHPKEIQALLDKFAESFPNIDVHALNLTEAIENAKGPWVLVRTLHSGTWIGRQCCRNDYYAGFGVHLKEARQVLNSLRFDDAGWIASTGTLSNGLKFGVVTQVELVGVYESQPLTPAAVEALRKLPEWK